MKPPLQSTFSSNALKIRSIKRTREHFAWFRPCGLATRPLRAEHRGARQVRARLTSQSDNINCLTPTSSARHSCPQWTHRCRNSCGGSSHQTAKPQSSDDGREVQQSRQKWKLSDTPRRKRSAAEAVNTESAHHRGNHYHLVPTDGLCVCLVF